MKAPVEASKAVKVPPAGDQLAGLSSALQLSGVNGAVGMPFNVPYLVHAVSKGAASCHIGENNVSVIGEKGLRELVAFTSISRNMEFHHKKASSKNSFSLAERQYCNRGAPSGRI